MSKYSIKSVPRGTIDCPVCNSVLMWKKKGSVITRAEKKRDKQRQQSDLLREFIL
jgi:hypothetical protein